MHSGVPCHSVCSVVSSPCSRSITTERHGRRPLAARGTRRTKAERTRCGVVSRPRHSADRSLLLFVAVPPPSPFSIPRFAFRISPVYAPFYLALPSWHPEKKLRPLSPNDLQCFPSEDTAHPRTFRCRVGRGCDPDQNRHQRGSSPMNCLSKLKFDFPHIHSYPCPSAPIRGSKTFPAPHCAPRRPAVPCVICVLCGYLPIAFGPFGPLRPFPALATPFPALGNSIKPRKSMVQITSNNVR